MEVLLNTQTASGLECPEITGTPKSIEELPKFDTRSMKPWRSWSHWLKRSHRLQPRK